MGWCPHLTALQSVLVTLVTPPQEICSAMWMVAPCAMHQPPHHVIGRHVFVNVPADTRDQHGKPVHALMDCVLQCMHASHVVM